MSRLLMYVHSMQWTPRSTWHIPKRVMDERPHYRGGLRQDTLTMCSVRITADPDALSPSAGERLCPKCFPREAGVLTNAVARS